MDVNEAAGSPAAGPGQAEILARLAEQMREIAAAPAAGSGAEADAADGPGRAGSVGPGRRLPSGSSDARSDRRSGRGPAEGAAAQPAPGHPEDDPGDPEAVARAICLRLLTGAARPRAGLAAALRRKGIPDEVAERVLDRLTEVGLIDDEAYAQLFVASRHRQGGLGAGALRQELTRKGIDAQTAASAVAVVDWDAEYQRARALLERRVDAAMAHGVDTARRRLLGLLARRGYPGDLSRQVVHEVLAAYDAETDDGWS